MIVSRTISILEAEIRKLGGYSVFGLCQILRRVGSAEAISARIMAVMANSGVLVVAHMAIPAMAIIAQSRLKPFSSNEARFLMTVAMNTRSGLIPRASVAIATRPTPACSSAMKTTIGMIDQSNQLTAFGLA